MLTSAVAGTVSPYTLKARLATQRSLSDGSSEQEAPFSPTSPRSLPPRSLPPRSLYGPSSVPTMGGLNSTGGSGSSSISISISRDNITISGGKRKPVHDDPEADEAEDGEQEQQGQDEDEDNDDVDMEAAPLRMHPSTASHARVAEQRAAAQLDETMSNTDDHTEGEEDGDDGDSARKAGQRRSKRPSRGPAMNKVLDDLDDDEEIDAAMVADKVRALELLNRKLAERTRELNRASNESKNLNMADRKKVRNRQASCVSRLKKKIQQVQMGIIVDDQSREIVELQRLLKERDVVLRRHNLLHHVTPCDPRPTHLRATAAAAAATVALAATASVAEPVDVVPTVAQATPKRPRGRPRKHPRPEDIAAAAATMPTASTDQLSLPPKGIFTATVTFAPSISTSASWPSAPPSALLRQISVPNPVCICAGERGNLAMITCNHCEHEFHLGCLGLSAPSPGFVCPRCQSGLESLKRGEQLSRIPRPVGALKPPAIVSSVKRSPQLLRAADRRPKPASKERLYFLQQCGPNAFMVGTETPKIKFRVILGPQTCSCKAAGPCNHLLFILTKVLKLAPTDPRVSARSLQNFETEALVAKYEEVRLRHLRAKSKFSKSPEAADCAICLNEMNEEENLLSCAHCRNFLHQNCMAVWTDSQRQSRDTVQCPLCRSRWLNPPLYIAGLHPHAQAAAADVASAAAESDPGDLPLAPLVCFDRFRFARPWVAVFGERLVSCFLSSEWSVREAALKKFGATLHATITQADSAASLPCLVAILERACADPVLKIFDTALAIVSTLRSFGDANTLNPVIDRILLKCGDSNRPTRERSLRALCDLLHRNVISLESLAACTCSPYKESTPNDCDTPVQPWRWLLGRLTFLLHLVDSGLVSGPDAHLFLRKIRTWCRGNKQFPHLRVRQLNTSLVTILRRDKNLRSTAASDTGVDVGAAAGPADPQDPPSDDEADCGKCAHESVESLPLPAIDDSYVERRAWIRGELLGAGAFSHVYRAVDLATGRMMAVKQLSLVHSAGEREMVASIQRELSVMRLRPANAYNVAYYGFVQDSEHVNIFMELITGCSLAEYIDHHGALPLQRVRAFARDVLMALVYLHGLGVIHRDVKGANVLVDAQSGCLKLCDYGVSGLLHNGVTVSSALLSSHGTPAFMAPEVIRGEPYGRRADVWSFGCALIEMASGKAPWSELPVAHPFALMFQIAQSSNLPAIPESLGPDGIALVHACLERVYANRPASASLVDHPFFAALEQ